MVSSADAVAILSELADTCVDRFAAPVLEGQYGAAVSFLIQIGALTPGDPQASIACQQCDRDHAPVVEFDPATARHFYFCAEAGRVEVEDAKLATLCLDPEWLVGWLRRELPILPPARRRALVPAFSAGPNASKSIDGCGKSRPELNFARCCRARKANNPLGSRLRQRR
jgi:hypothetical protein